MTNIYTRSMLNAIRNKSCTLQSVAWCFLFISFIFIGIARILMFRRSSLRRDHTAKAVRFWPIGGWLARTKVYPFAIDRIRTVPNECIFVWVFALCANYESSHCSVQCVNCAYAPFSYCECVARCALNCSNQRHSAIAGAHASTNCMIVAAVWCFVRSFVQSLSIYFSLFFFRFVLLFVFHDIRSWR